MVRYIDDYRDRFGVEPICKALPIAPSTRYAMKARQQDPDRLPLRAIRDEQLKREGFKVARCTVARLMREMGIRGITRSKKLKTTIPAPLDARSADRVNRDFTVSEPNRLWVADLPYIATWRGFVFVTFVIDAFARRIVGWRVSSSLRTDIALYALE